MTSRLDYFDARRRLMRELQELGLTCEAIAERFVVYPDQVEAILRLSTEPLPGSARAQADELRVRVTELERELHAYREPPPLLPPQTTTDVRALLSNPDPALCGCQYWIETDSVIAPDAHQPRCLFAPKP